MAEGKGTNTAEQEKEPGKRPPWWKRLWARTGFGDKTLWDLLQVLIVPLVLVGIGLVFEMQQTAREERRAEVERELAEQRAQDEALQAYLDQMSDLLLAKDGLRASEEDSEARTLARARTLTVLGRFDASHKTAVMQFLVEGELVQHVDERDPIISLRGADLSDADLAFADLFGANLRDASLRGADLFGADLRSARLFSANLNDADLRDAFLSDADLIDANLSNANLRDAFLSDADLRYADLGRANLSEASGWTEGQLSAAKSLEDATMPNGQKYEDWLKSNNQEENK